VRKRILWDPVAFTMDTISRYRFELGLGRPGIGAGEKMYGSFQFGGSCLPLPLNH